MDVSFRRMSEGWVGHMGCGMGVVDVSEYDVDV